MRQAFVSPAATTVGRRSAGARLRGVFIAVLPALFTAGYVVGTGSVTTISSAGAAYGFTLVWTLVMASVFSWVMFAAVDHCTVVSGATMLHNFRRHFGGVLTITLIAGVALTQISSVIGVTAILSDVVQEWSRSVLGGSGVPPIITATASTLLLVTLFWTGRHTLFLRVLAVLVALMGLCFLATAIWVRPSWSEFAAGLVPSVPRAGDPHLLIAGMIGTTMASVVLVSRSIVVQDSGWTLTDLARARRDALFAASLLFVVNAAIMACAAGTLWRAGYRVQRAIDMVRMLEPLAGATTTTVFVIGIVAAGLSSLFPNYLLGAWMLSDYRGTARDMSLPLYRAIVVVTALAGLYVPVFGGNAVQIMIASQAVSPIVMPVLATCLLVVLLRQDRKHRSVPLLWALAGTVGFTIYIAALALRGFLDLNR